jgi:hypothetical protein
MRSNISSAPTPPPASAEPLSGAAVIPASRSGSELSCTSAAARPAKPASGVTLPLLPLMSLAEGWPEAVCNEIVQLELVGAKVALPIEEIERGLKQGRISCSWRLVRS